MRHFAAKRFANRRSAGAENLSPDISSRYLTNLRAGTSLQESDIKEARDILDVIPLVTPELLKLTRWLRVLPRPWEK